MLPDYLVLPFDTLVCMYVHFSGVRSHICLVLLVCCHLLLLLSRFSLDLGLVIASWKYLVGGVVRSVEGQGGPEGGQGFSRQVSAGSQADPIRRYPPSLQGHAGGLDRLKPPGRLVQGVGHALEEEVRSLRAGQKEAGDRDFPALGRQAGVGRPDPGNQREIPGNGDHPREA